MIEDNEHAFTRQMLGRAEMKKAPDYLGDTIMQKIQQEQYRQLYRRVVLTTSLKVACGFVVLGLLTLSLIRKGISLDNTWETIQSTGHSIAQTLKQMSILLPLGILLLLGKAIRLFKA